MDMKINAEKVIAERKSRAWTQQHLADACGVSMRTIQRVENNGSGSLETIKALASCFELDVAKLFETAPDVKQQVDPVVKTPIKITKTKSKSKIVALCSMALALMSSAIFITPTSMASDITILAQKVSTNTSENYMVYNNNVEIFLPAGTVFEVSSYSNEQITNGSVFSGSVEVYLDDSILLMNKALITTMENGTKITTDYAKLSHK